MARRPERFEDAIGVVRWLMTDARPPGMLGPAVAFASSQTLDAEVVREGDGWRVRHGGNDRLLSNADVLKLFGDEYWPRYVYVAPDLAAEFFQEAVMRAEHSVDRLHEVVRHLDDMRAATTEHGDAIPFVLASSALDRAMRASLSAVILAVAAAEAQLNQWAEHLGGWSGNEDRSAVPEKCRALARKRDVNIPLGRGELHALAETVRLRHQLVHAKPVPQPVPTMGPKAPLPGRTLSEEGRRACLRVREALIVTARAIEADPPRYLAYCPLGDPTDDEVWRNANLMTGLRPDPAFPPLSETRPEGTQD